MPTALVPEQTRFCLRPALVIVGLELFHNVVGDRCKGDDPCGICEAARSLQFLQGGEFPKSRADPEKHGIVIVFGEFAVFDRGFDPLIDHFSEE